MVKILICGFVDNEGWPLLVSRLEELQFSNHGPFELLVLSQPLVASYDVISSSFERLQKLEIQICAFAEGNMEIWPSYWTIQTKAVGIFNGPKHLTIAYMFQDQSGEVDSEVSSAIGGLGYRGCDLLITSKWPTGCAHYLGESDVQECQCLNISPSKNISAFASSVRPRYHIVGGLGKFYQRPPYINHRIDNTPQLFTRLISIDAVSTSKDKNKKWLHALSLNPIIYMKASDLEEAPTSFTENPYNNSRYHPNDMSSEQPHKRFRHLEGSAAPNSFFFDGVTNSSSSALSNTQFNNGSNKTLFIGGLAKDSNETDLKRILPDAVHVRRITGKAYAFVEFSSQESATKVLQNANKGHGLVLHNRKLSVGWSAAKAGGDERPSTDGSSNFDLGTAMRDRVLIPPTEDSKILFIGNVPNIPDMDIKLKSLFEGVVSVKTGKLFAFLEFESFERAMAVVTKSINEQIKLNDVPLVVGWAKSPKLSHPTDCRVLFVGNVPMGTTAHDIEAICTGWTSIKQPAGRDYAFIEFDNPEKAIECFQNLISNQVQINGNLLKIGWAKGRAADKLEQSSDCWFCLASPSVKVFFPQYINIMHRIYVLINTFIRFI
jgi:RNA recognition motif-containing protein